MFFPTFSLTDLLQHIFLGLFEIQFEQFLYKIVEDTEKENYVYSTLVKYSQTDVEVILF